MDVQGSRGGIVADPFTMGMHAGASPVAKVVKSLGREFPGRLIGQIRVRYPKDLPE